MSLTVKAIATIVAGMVSDTYLSVVIGMKTYLNGTLQTSFSLDCNPIENNVDDTLPTLIIGKSPDLNSNDNTDFFVGRFTFLCDAS